MKNEVAIVAAVRTPFDKFGGPMKDMSTVELGALVIKEAVARAGLDVKEIDEVYLGINMPSSNRSIARMAALTAGLPEECNALTVDRACCSSIAAIAMGYRAIALGEADIAVGGGAENMSKVPYFLEDLRWGKRLGDVVLKDIMVVSCPYTGERRAVQAGAVSFEQYGITRTEQDTWAARSHKLATQAYEEGKFAQEMMPVSVELGKGKNLTIDKDQSLRPDTTVESLAKLPTVYGNPTVTAGNAPGLNTGSAAVVLMNAKTAAAKGITPLATIVSHAQVSSHPRGITYTPAYAALKALKKANLTIDDIKIVEINEAFAAMPLVSTKILGENDPEKTEAIRAKTNVNGGAIAIGHPTGASAARLLMTLCFELKRRGGGYGLVTICGGVGEGESIVVRVEP
jgi:acetyl-CoA C-acetyltransferase